MEDEANTTGRLGRFNRRFDGVGGVGRDGKKSVEWANSEGSGDKQGELVDPSQYIKVKERKGRK